MKCLPAIVACVAVVAACAPPAEETAVDLEEARASLRAAADAYHDGAHRADADALVSLNAADVLIFPPNAAEERGTEGARKIAEGFTTAPNFEAQFVTRVAEVADSGELGYTVADATLSFDGPDGDPVRDEVRDFHVWKRQEDGSWKVVVDVWNSRLPLPPTE